jgi:hypothetical protein
MRWGYNRALHRSGIQVVPMTEALGTTFLRLALRARSDRAFRTAGLVKDSVQARLGPRAAGWLRKHVLAPGTAGR